MQLFNKPPRQMHRPMPPGPGFRRPVGPQNPLFGRPQRPMQNRQALQGQQRLQSMGQKANGFMSSFMTEDGNMDFGKISQTFSQVHGIYGQVKPLISPLISRFIK